ncbi:MAG: glycosyltransferase, partial [Alphaproteobacteria bacterium]
FLDFNSNFFNILLVQGILLANKKICKSFENSINNNFNLSDLVFFFNTELEISNIINKYYEDSDHRLKIGKEASKFVLKCHTYKNRVDQILEDLDL